MEVNKVLHQFPSKARDPDINLIQLQPWADSTTPTSSQKGKFRSNVEDIQYNARLSVQDLHD